MYSLRINKFIPLPFFLFISDRQLCISILYQRAVSTEFSVDDTLKHFTFYIGRYKKAIKSIRFTPCKSL